MIDTATTKDASLVDWSVKSRHGVAYASTLGLPPGVMPAVVRLRSPRTGSVKGFVLREVETHYGDVVSATYGSADGLGLLVLNS